LTTTSKVRRHALPCFGHARRKTPCRYLQPNARPGKLQRRALRSACSFVRVLMTCQRGRLTGLPRTQESAKKSRRLPIDRRKLCRRLRRIVAGAYQGGRRIANSPHNSSRRRGGPSVLSRT
jgi:hypothetical protein